MDKPDTHDDSAPDFAETSAPIADTDLVGLENGPDVADQPLPTEQDHRRLWPQSAYSQTEPGLSPVLTWGMLLLILLIAATALSANLGQRDATNPAEVASLWAAQHYWQHQPAPLSQATASDPFIDQHTLPLATQPGIINLLITSFWSDGSVLPEEAPLNLLIWRARLISVLAGLILIVAVFRVGLSLQGRHLAVAASVVAGSMLVVHHQARLAGEVTPLAAAVATALAGLIWAHKKTAAHWVMTLPGICLACLGATVALLIAGQLAAALIALPAVGLILLDTTRRRRGLALLLAVCAGTALLMLLGGQLPQHHATMADAMITTSGISLTPSTLLLICVGCIVLTLPWTLWLVLSLWQPFGRATAEYRRQLLIAWQWWGTTLLILLLYFSHQPRYLLLLAAPASLLIGQVFAAHQRLADAGRHDPVARRFLVLHWISLIGLSVVWAPLLISQASFAIIWLDIHQWLANLDILAAPMHFSFEPIGPIHPLLALASGGILLLIAWLGAYAHWQNHPRRALYLTAGWFILLSITITAIRSHAADARHILRDDAQRVRAITTDTPLLRLDSPYFSPEYLRAFDLYMQKPVYHISPRHWQSNLHDLRQQVYVLADTHPHTDTMMLHDHAELILEEIGRDHGAPQSLWRYDP